MRDLPLKTVKMETPQGWAETKIISGKKLALVPILRAGLGLIEGVTSLIPAAKIGHIGIFCEPGTHDAVKYYSKMPDDISEREVVVIDAMLATGISAITAIQDLKEMGVKNIKFLCILCSPQGKEALETAHPDVDIYCAGMDEGINEEGYIVPGLGDAGDRMFGTK